MEYVTKSVHRTDDRSNVRMMLYYKINFGQKNQGVGYPGFLQKINLQLPKLNSKFYEWHFFSMTTYFSFVCYEIFCWLIGIRYVEHKFGELQYCNSGKKIFFSNVSSLISSSCYQHVCLSEQSQLWHKIIYLPQLFWQTYSTLTIRQSIR